MLERRESLHSDDTKLTVVNEGSGVAAPKLAYSVSGNKFQKTKALSAELGARANVRCAHIFYLFATAKHLFATPKP